jgi:acyl-CoA thioester hydrolase
MTRTPDVTLAFQVKGYDIDVGGVVHNSVYLLWLDDIRTAFLEKVQSIEQQVKLGYIPVLSKTEISYKRAVKFGDRPVGRMHLELVSKLRWRISCEFVVDGVVTTHAIQEGCLVDQFQCQSHLFATGVKRRIRKKNTSSRSSCSPAAHRTLETEGIWTILTPWKPWFARFSADLNR